MKILHILLEEIKFDARVKKEIKSIRSNKFNVDLIYLKSCVTDEAYSDNDITIDHPKVSKLVYKLKIIYWVFAWFYIIVKLFKVLKKKKYNIIHVHNIQACNMLLLIKRFTCNKNSKLVYDTHELFSGMNYKYKILERFYRYLEPKMMRKADFIIHANQSRMNYIINKYKLNSSKNLFVNNYSEKNEKISNLKIDRLEKLKRTGKKIVIYQGSISSGRNLYNIARNYHKGNKDKVLVLIGEGNEVPMIKKFIKENDTTDSIILIGKVPHSQLLNYTTYADLGIVTYSNNCLNNYYCAPNKISEYAICKVPVLGIDLPEIRKVIAQFDMGSLFKEDEICDIGNIIDKILIKYPDGISNDTYTQFFKEINWKNESRKLIELYDKIEKEMVRM